jgi:hypothetical protein
MALCPAMTSEGVHGSDRHLDVASVQTDRTIPVFHLNRGTRKSCFDALPEDFASKYKAADRELVHRFREEIQISDICVRGDLDLCSSNTFDRILLSEFCEYTLSEKTLFITYAYKQALASLRCIRMNGRQSKRTHARIRTSTMQ